MNRKQKRKILLIAWLFSVIIACVVIGGFIHKSQTEQNVSEDIHLQGTVLETELIIRDGEQGQNSFLRTEVSEDEQNVDIPQESNVNKENKTFTGEAGGNNSYKNSSSEKVETSKKHTSMDNNSSDSTEKKPENNDETSKVESDNAESDKETKEQETEETESRVNKPDNNELEIIPSNQQNENQARIGVRPAEAKKAKADAKAAEEAKKAEAETVLKKLLASGMSADEILKKLK